MKVSAVIPTRGDVDLSRVVDSLRHYPEITEIIIKIGDTPFNRYRGAVQAANELIYTQDDDCVTDITPLLAAYDSAFICNAMTPEHAKSYPGEETLVGFGALFDKRRLAVFGGWKRDALFYRECDRVFATLNPHKTVYPKITILPHAYSANRLYRQPEHGPSHVAMRERISQYKAAR
jgi:hypothetical protein